VRSGRRCTKEKNVGYQRKGVDIGTLRKRPVVRMNDDGGTQAGVVNANAPLHRAERAEPKGSTGANAKCVQPQHDHFEIRQLTGLSTEVMLCFLFGFFVCPSSVFAGLQMCRAHKCTKILVPVEIHPELHLVPRNLGKLKLYRWKN
jgi:hypothetical protein